VQSFPSLPNDEEKAKWKILMQSKKIYDLDPVL
jgi:hypothetical protein